MEKLKVLCNGLNLKGNPLIPSIDEEALTDKILGKQHETFRFQEAATASAFSYRTVDERKIVDLGNPVSAGWTFLVSSTDPAKKEIIDVIKPLAEHRQMEEPGAPLIYHGESEMKWYEWLAEELRNPEKKVVPRYVMIVGGPKEVPFHFQSFLNVSAFTGRVQFESTKDLAAYCDKLIAIETSNQPIVDREAIFFSTDHGRLPTGELDPTYFTNKYMAEPLADYIDVELLVDVKRLKKTDATRAKLAKTISNSKPAIVYTASHGLGDNRQSLDDQKHYNGAICCQEFYDNPSYESLYSIDDVPKDTPFLKGSIFFQFACFGYGTPEKSDYSYWLGEDELNSEESFIAAFPKKLISNPEGPIAYVGHVDTAWLHGFFGPEKRIIANRWSNRIFPYKSAVEQLLRGQPVGYAMFNMHQEYSVMNQRLSQAMLFKIKEHPISAPFKRDIANIFIKRSDAQNYFIYGDPAARLMMPVT